MVGLSDFPCVGVAIDKISEATVEAGIRGLNYTLCTKSLVNDLNSEIRNVTTREEEVIRKVAEARNDGKTVRNHVAEWQKEVENIKTHADELSRQRTSCNCFNVLHFPNPVSRFRLGRKAARQSKNVVELTVSGDKLLAIEIAYLPSIDYFFNSDTTYQIFGSRKETYGKLWEALINKDGNSIIGIYGMAGVGKTRMMEEACKDAMEKKIFDKVARVDVGGEMFDVIKLQEKLAVSLGCHLELNNDKRRAVQLKNSLINGGNTLVIFDDVWDDIHLKSVGIPFSDGSSKGCKILLTSRNKRVCQANNCADPIEVTTLTEGEAWEMFMNTVGTQKINSLQLQDSSLALKVCKECGALPLLIDALGKALKDVSNNSWEDTLSQIVKYNFKEIDGIDSKVYTFLDFSFKKLTDAAKTCLFLCCVFPEDADIDIKMLFDVAKGSELLESTRNISGLVDNLKSSSLLLQGKDDYTVKVHDVIRGVARYVAATDPNYAFISIRCKSRWEDIKEYATRRLLHLVLEGTNISFPDDLVCPQLHTLWINSVKPSSQLSSRFFNGFKILKVLLLKGKFLFEDQFSISALEKLRVLILDGCKISQTFISSVCGNLETLCIWKCDIPSPLDLPELKNLSKLELLQESWSSRIGMMANAISRLSNLEELIIPHGITISGDRPISRELGQLSCLRKLVISVDNSPYLDIDKIFPGLHEFNINVGHQWCDSKEKSAITFRKIHIQSEWMPNAFTMVERAEVVDLIEVEGLQNGLSAGNMREGFAKLRELKIDHCYDMEHVASWDRRNQPMACFTNLISVDIVSCRQMKYVFSSSVAKCLLQLQTLQVRFCREIEEIVRLDDHAGDSITFPNLKEVDLQSLQSLTGFYGNKVGFPFSQAPEIKDRECQKLKVFRVRQCQKLEYVIPGSMLHRLENLETFFIDGCKSLQTVFQHFSLANLDGINNAHIVFPALTEFTLKGSPLLKHWWNYDSDNPEVSPNQNQPYRIPKVTFPNIVSFEMTKLNTSLIEEIELGRDDGSPSKLKNLIISDDSLEIQLLPPQWKLQLENLETLDLDNCGWPGHSLFNGALTFKKLRKLQFSNCKSSTLFTSSVFRSLDQLEELKVSCCSLLKEIVEEDARGDSTNEKTLISLRQLKSVYLTDLPNLQSIGISACYMPALVMVDVHKCERITTLFTRSAFRSLHQLEELKVSYCSSVEEIVNEDARGEGINVKTPISLPQLKSVSLKDLPNLKSIGISACYMPSLFSVEVHRCKLITTLFTCSAFKNLELLVELEVSRCPLLEEIVEDEMDGETPGMSKNMISLLLLKSIKLGHLPRLRSFSSSSTFTFNMPALDSIHLYECPCIDKFTSLLITAPLVKIFSEFNYIKDVSDLNNFLRAEPEDNSNTKDGANDGEPSENNQELVEPE